MKRIITAVFVFSATVYCITAAAKNAGMLLVARNDNGAPLILLGKEPPPNSTWADFGGRPEPGESSRDTALREASEETRLVFGKYAVGHRGEKLTSAIPLQEQKRILKRSMRYLQINIVGRVAHPQGYYEMFVAEVEHIPASVFNRSAIVDHAEKTEYAWVPAHQFLTAMSVQTDRHHAHFEGKKIRRQIFDVLHTHADALARMIDPDAFDRDSPKNLQEKPRQTLNYDKYRPKTRSITERIRSWIEKAWTKVTALL